MGPPTAFKKTAGRTMKKRRSGRQPGSPAREVAPRARWYQPKKRRTQPGERWHRLPVPLVRRVLLAGGIHAVYTMARVCRGWSRAVGGAQVNAMWRQMYEHLWLHSALPVEELARRWPAPAQERKGRSMVIQRQPSWRQSCEQRIRCDQLWEAAACQPQRLVAQTAVVHDPQFGGGCSVHPVTQRIFHGSDYGVCRVKRFDKSVTQTLWGHVDSVTCSAFLADGQYVVSGSRDKKVIVWRIDGESEGPAVELCGAHTVAVRDCACGPRTAYSLGLCGSVWDLHTGRGVFRTPQDDTAALIRPLSDSDCQVFCVAGQGSWRVYDRRSKLCVQEVRHRGCRWTDLKVHGHRLAAVDADGLSLWDVRMSCGPVGLRRMGDLHRDRMGAVDFDCSRVVFTTGGGVWLTRWDNDFSSPRQLCRELGPHSSAHSITMGVDFAVVHVVDCNDDCHMVTLLSIRE